MNIDEISPKRNAKRTVKGKVVKYGSDEDEDDDQENIESDYIGSDSESEKKIKKSKSKTKPAVNSFIPFDNFFSPRSFQASPEKKNALNVLMQNRQTKEEPKAKKPRVNR